MRLLGPTRHHRLNEAAAVVYLLLSIGFVLSLASYHPQDPSWNTVTGASRPENLIGFPGAYVADLCLQIFGLTAYLLPLLSVALAYKWLLSRPIGAPLARVAGAVLMVGGVCTLVALGPLGRLFGDSIPPGGIVGMLLADYLVGSLNTTGAVLVTGASLIVAVYLVSTFSMDAAAGWFARPAAYFRARFELWRQYRAAKRAEAKEKARAKAAVAEEKLRVKSEKQAAKPQKAKKPSEAEAPADARTAEAPPTAAAEVDTPPEADEIPIHVLEDAPPARLQPVPEAVAERPPWEEMIEEPEDERGAPARRTDFRLPPTALLTEPQGRSAYDSQELKDIAARIKAKFEEFNVLGSVVQINPGPVVTTFEFKPEAGIKLSRITTLSEDLCLGLQAESVLIERIPGKPTVGIEVPNSKSEIISLRQILESEEFLNSQSGLTIALGKDINGRIKVAAMETMPHLLIAGSTGSGKSVMLNSMIMSILYKSTPNEVRMIMVDPKRVELGIYEGIPHLLTPVITDPKKATNALRNAVLEMERRLKLLASKGVRNIDQFNRKITSLREEMGYESMDSDLQPLPYILIIIDELADLMMLERAGVEECVTRLAQMARAVGMHVVLATQRPSVDVITGLIKANFPARISFRVATRVDSRTILDSMGAEHLLGKGDMLFLPPGSSRLMRVHGAYVSETETNRVVEFWKEQAQPQYDSTYLAAPPSDDGDGEEEEFDGTEDPMYQDAVRIVMEQGKASTSTLQRRLRLGYGRAARILDMMQRDGIIGPPDGSRPREVLKRPDWLDEVQEQYR